MPRVTINGDDFGMNDSCTKAILRALREGLITDTTMMANGSFFVEAVQMAKEFGMTDRIGVHFNLTEGRPLTDGITNAPLFVKDGVFHRAFLHRPRELNEAERKAVFAELYAQAERIRGAGIAITHVDSHHYLHTYQTLAPIFAEVCRQCGIDSIRLNRTLSTAAHPRVTDGRIDNRFWREQGLRTAEHFGRYSDLLDSEIPDRTEILVHPDLDKDGRLIDRTAVIDGYPSGMLLAGEIYRGKSLTLCRYQELVM